MGFDLTILAFTLTYLLKHKAKSSLWSLLFTDGLVYFLTAFCFNALPAVCISQYHDVNGSDSPTLRF